MCIRGPTALRCWLQVMARLTDHYWSHLGRTRRQLTGTMKTILFASLSSVVQCLLKHHKCKSFFKIWSTLLCKNPVSWEISRTYFFNSTPAAQPVWCWHHIVPTTVDLHLLVVWLTVSLIFFKSLFSPLATTAWWEILPANAYHCSTCSWKKFNGNFIFFGENHVDKNCDVPRVQAFNDNADSFCPKHG